MPELEQEDRMLELETGTNYSQDNAREVEKGDDNLAAIVVDSVEPDKKVEGLYLEKGTAEEDEAESWNETTNCQRSAGCGKCY